ncbi:hypothetical protein [Litorisediminicola beolgyonensis]|uniref:Uncharacterized protein n=1 Tax=Litorisediminicola beolgyonensis TaxID=1173614 RepID=A0ABW3ZIQ7_9RHOB
MASYMISFRIANNSTYLNRYNSLVERVKFEAEDGLAWEETTSLIIIRSSKTAEQLAGAIYLGSEMSLLDTLLVVNASTGIFATRGEVKYPATLASVLSQSNVRRTLLG